MQARGWGTTTPAWVVLLAEEESQLQVTSDRSDKSIIIPHDKILKRNWSM